MSSSDNTGGKVAAVQEGGGGGKSSWPELVGLSIKDANQKIQAERPDLQIDVLPVGTIVTQEFNPKRVRIWVDTVAEIPRIG